MEIEAAVGVEAPPLGARAAARCDALGIAPYSEAEGQLTRRYLTPAHAAALDALRGWMTIAGMEVRLDAAANLIGRYEGQDAGAPALIIGSHIDSVRDAGRYDGPLGIMLGIDLVEALSREGRRLAFPIEMVAFGDEEGSRFPASMTCSRALAGVVDPAVLAMRDGEGVSLGEALAAFGAAGSLAEAAKPSIDALAFFEVHIEQGPVLEAEGLALGAVSAIAAQKRLAARFTGTAGHAGTTPMALRKDPGPAAAEAILAVERICRAGDHGLVGTVGRLAARPGATNVIPGAVEFSLDVRAETSAVRDAAVAEITAEFEVIAARRGLTLTLELVQALAESPCHPALIGLLEQALGDLDVPPRRLPSGAGHDAMVMASLCPTAMLFIRCAGGISHNPAEAVAPDDCVLALAAMHAFVLRLDAACRADPGLEFLK